MSSRDQIRAALGFAAVVPPSKAAEWLPWGDHASLRWLRQHGMVRSTLVDGEEKEVVLWGEVVKALGWGAEVDAPTSRASTGVKLRRSKRL